MKTTLLQTAFFNWYLGTTLTTISSNIYISLHSGDPTLGGNELTCTGYARHIYTPVFSSAPYPSVENSNNLRWPGSGGFSGACGAVTHFAIWNDTGMVFADSLYNPANLDIGDSFVISPSDLKVNLLNGFVGTIAEQMIKWVFGLGTPPTPPTSLEMSLHIGNPDDLPNTEITAAEYARQSLSLTIVGSFLKNNTEITFPVALSNWGNIDNFGIHNESGVLLSVGTSFNSNIQTNYIFNVLVNGLSIGN